MEKIDGCKNNPENLPTTKVSKYITSGFSMYITSIIKIIENKRNVCRASSGMKNCCKS